MDLRVRRASRNTTKINSLYPESIGGSVMLDNLQLDKTKKYAIVMGNEVKGVQQNVVDNCVICIEIPQYGTKHSLNVSVTTGIVIWDFFKQLSESSTV